MLVDLGCIRRRLVRWYRRYRRDLPWRPPRGSAPHARPDPYHVLVSEVMLQQTRVQTVVPYFRRFIANLPTLADLAGCDEQRLLRLWQGLGYYRRARNLLQAAVCINAEHGGMVPRKAADLRKIRGIGPYTAGAIASIAYDQPEPILDGNVSRVLCRLYALRGDPRTTAMRRKLWGLAANLVPTRGAGEFNSALMELGAMVCTPRSPNCQDCPLSALCRANAQNLQHRIPPSRRPRPLPTENRWTFCIRHRGRWLIEQRSPAGRWAGMWQFPTLPAGPTMPQDGALAKLLGLPVSDVRPLTTIRHALTHLRYTFHVWMCRGRHGESKANRKWLTLNQLDDYPLSAVHARIATLLKARSASRSDRLGRACDSSCRHSGRPFGPLIVP